MIKIEAVTLEAAYKDAASQLECSVTELKIEIVQAPSKGLFGLFKKPAIIVAIRESSKNSTRKTPNLETTPIQKIKQDSKEQTSTQDKVQTKPVKQTTQKVKTLKEEPQTQIFNDTIMPTSFVSMQDEENEYEVNDYLADYQEDDEIISQDMTEICEIVQKEINELFDMTCFSIDSIEVSVYDANTLLIEFKGQDAALLIGKEGYRYKALSYMIFNWINTKYQVQLRLEIAEFLKNQEEAIDKYLVSVCESIDRDGRAQTKILDGVLIQIALNELRQRYPQKYVVIRSTRDGLKYIIVNDYHAN